MTRSRDSIAAVAHRLGDLRDRVVFIGGATLDLLVTDPVSRAQGLRTTRDVDLLVEVGSLLEYQSTLRPLLISAGFTENVTDGIICRWNAPGGLVVDVMPTRSSVLGFSNQWYELAARHPEVHRIGSLAVRVISAPCFLATKLEAFVRRGASDYQGSHDLEDFVAVIEGRPTVVSDVSAAPIEVSEFLSRAASALLDREASRDRVEEEDALDGRAFLESLPGHLRGERDREGIVLERLDALRNLLRSDAEREPRR
jgi:hypothetical protein